MGVGGCRRSGCHPWRGRRILCIRETLPSLGHPSLGSEAVTMRLLRMRVVPIYPWKRLKTGQAVRV